MSEKPSKRTLQLRAVLKTYFAVSIVILLVLLAIGSGMMYLAHVDSGTETVEHSETIWSVSVGHDHSAEVIQENAVFPVGAELSDRTTYFTQIAPNLDVTPTVRYSASQASDVTVTITSELIIRGTSDDQVLWEQRDSLGSTEANVAPGEDVTHTFDINIPVIDSRMDTISSDLGDPGSMEVFVRSSMRIVGEIEGDSVDYGQSFDLELDPGGNQYHVPSDGSDTQGFTRTVTETVPVEYGPLYAIGGPLLILISLVGLGALSYAGYEQRLGITPAERAYLGYLKERNKFDEWITSIELPPSLLERPTARAASLTDLVDFAIDNETGVIQDPESKQLYVIGEEYLFTYKPPSPGASPEELEDVFDVPFDLEADAVADEDELEE